jgi:hypothetical protein
MKFKRNPSTYPVVIVLLLISMTSCNRGYGCPYDFSLDSFIVNIADTALELVSILF